MKRMILITIFAPFFYPYMKKIILFTILITPFSIFGFSHFTLSDKYKVESENHLTNIKMLTDGGENAEVYLSLVS